MIRKKGDTIYHTSAGGFIYHNGKILMIKNYYHGGIITPHGHVEKGESFLETAKREICEETGYCNLRVLLPLGKAVYTFKNGNVKNHKTEHRWLFALGSEKTKPKLDNNESRQLENRWYTIDGALRAATFENAKVDLRKIKLYLQKRVVKKGRK